MKARDVAGVQWTPFCYDRGGSRDLELRATAGLEVKKSDSFLESLFFNMKARDGTRTRGPDLGKVVLHQLSHSRILPCFSAGKIYNTSFFLSCQLFFQTFSNFFKLLYCNHSTSLEKPRPTIDFYITFLTQTTPLFPSGASILHA